MVVSVVPRSRLCRLGGKRSGLSIAQSSRTWRAMGHLRMSVSHHELRRDYHVLNQRLWDERAGIHADSEQYSFAQFEAEPTFLSECIRFDLPRLGPVSGHKAVHLQCHIGTDTISLARLGAQMTGVDYSAESLSQAARLARLTGADIKFVQADVYDSATALGHEQFDLVFTGIGALCWLPDIRRWAAVVAELLRPGGRLFLREAHPMLWTLTAPPSDQRLIVEYPYFERPEPTERDNSATCVVHGAAPVQTTTYEWNHGIGEAVTALLAAGMDITMLVEHDSVPWEALPGSMTCLEGGEWRLVDRPWRLPHSYTLQATKQK